MNTGKLDHRLLRPRDHVQRGVRLHSHGSKVHDPRFAEIARVGKMLTEILLLTGQLTLAVADGLLDAHPRRFELRHCKLPRTFHPAALLKDRFKFELELRQSLCS